MLEGTAKMSTSVVEHEQDSALALLSLQQGQPLTDRSAVEISPVAKLEGRDFEYYLRQNKVCVGRNSRLGDVDIHMGHSSFISRRHFEIRYCSPEFYLTARGKNGIFVDGHFHKKGSDPVTLSKK